MVWYIFVSMLHGKIQVMEHPLEDQTAAVNYANANGMVLFDKNDWLSNYHFDGKYLEAYNIENGAVTIDLEKLKDLKSDELTKTMLHNHVKREVRKKFDNKSFTEIAQFSINETDETQIIDTLFKGKPI